ncbi:MAG: adenylate/guanylate cyclase domain-containing protein [Actinobacteria bacterium]|nr:adenylate/guanylate cyclase domain-containing protein [Actinomycetota bacterium]
MKEATLLDRLSSLGITEGDDEQTRIQKRSFVWATIIYALLGIAWGSLYLVLGLTRTALIPFAYVVIAAVVMAFFAAGGAFAASRIAILTAWILLPLSVQLSLGGFVAGSAVVLWSVAAPLGALIFSPRQAPWWIAAFIAALSAAWVVDPRLSPSPGVTVEIMRAFFAMNLAGVGAAMFFVLRDFFIRLQQARSELRREQERSEYLLLNVLPESIAQRLKDGEEVIADRFDDVTIVFADLVGFTPLSDSLSAEGVVAVLDSLVADFDRLADRCGMEKIRTMGDGYMAVAGAPDTRPDHVQASAEFALEMLDETHRHMHPKGERLELRIGIDSGPVVAGVIGLRKFVYDLWGDPVNVASRMQSQGMPGRIHVTERVRDRLQGSYRFEERGVVEVKGKGPMSTYFLIERA